MRHDHVGPFARPSSSSLRGTLLSQVDAELTHRFHDLGMDMRRRCRAGRARLVPSLGRRGETAPRPSASGRRSGRRRTGLHARRDRSRRGRTGTRARRSRRRAGARRCRATGVQVAGDEAGPIERIGFIDAPEIGPPNIASSPIVPPIAIAAASPTARVSVATARITNIRNAVSTISQKNDCACEPDGSVAPTCATSAERRRSTARCGERARRAARPSSRGARPREVAGQREREGDGPVEMSAGDVPDGVDHHHDHEAERDRDADVPELRASSRRP